MDKIPKYVTFSKYLEPIFVGDGMYSKHVIGPMRVVAIRKQVYQNNKFHIISICSRGETAKSKFFKKLYE